MNVRAPFLAAACVLAIAGAAHAQPTAAALIDLKASLDGGNTWTDYALTTPGATFRVGVFMSANTGVGLAGCTFQIRGAEVVNQGGYTTSITGAGLGRLAPFNAGPAALSVFALPGGFRIDLASDGADSRSAGIPTAQLPPTLPGFSGANPALVFAFEVHDIAGILINLSTPLDQIRGTPQDPLTGILSVYTDLSSPATLNIPSITIDGCTIDSYTPAPAAIPLLTGGLLFGAFRRGRAARA